ncbi:MAG: hypothetical protein ACTHOP_22040 [Mesorhizobium sp.]
MPRLNTWQSGGVLKPGELALLSRVMKKLDADHLNETDKAALAHRVMGSYMAGVTDEQELAIVSKQALGR